MAVRVQSKEWISKRVTSLRGKKRTPEQKKGMSNAQKQRFKRTGPNRTFGIIPSEETRKRISESLRGHKVSVNTRAKVSKSLMGHVGAKYIHTEETKRKISKMKKGKKQMGGVIKHSEKTKRKMSEIATLRIQEGHHRGGRGKKGYFYSKKNQKNLFFRSYLERDWYILLEKMENVKNYKIESIHIPYIWEGCVHLYIPDLLIVYTNGFWDLIELKPEYEWKNPKNQAKWKAAREWCEEKQNRIRQFKVYGYNRLRKFV